MRFTVSGFKIPGMVLPLFLGIVPAGLMAQPTGGQVGAGSAAISGGAGALVNAGTITAATAELKAAGGDAYALAIHNTSAVRSEVVSSGTLAATSADGAQGGDVRLLGHKITLEAGALVDVSGALGGETALIGGDFQGKNPAVPNAQTAMVAPTR